MNKNLFLMLAFILVACSPQVTEETDCCLPVTTALPTTETPIPTPTLHPDFITLQNFISDSSENLTLLPNGTIENNGIVIPNLHVDQNGVINLIVNNEHIAIEQSKVNFDDENGLTVDGYIFNDNGAWVEAQSGVVINGVEFELSDEVDANGFSVVTSWKIDNESLSVDKQAELLLPFDIERLGLGDTAVIIYNAETQQLQVVSVDDHSEVIGNWNHGGGEMIWDGDGLKEALFSDGVATVWEMSGVNPVDREQAEADSAELDKKVDEYKQSHPGYISGSTVYTSNFYLYDDSSSSAIGGVLVTNKKLESFAVDRKDITGVIFFLNDNGELVALKVKNFDCTTRFWH